MRSVCSHKNTNARIIYYAVEEDRPVFVTSLSSQYGLVCIYKGLLAMMTCDDREWAYHCSDTTLEQVAFEFSL